MRLGKWYLTAGGREPILLISLDPDLTCSPGSPGGCVGFGIPLGAQLCLGQTLSTALWEGCQGCAELPQSRHLALKLTQPPVCRMTQLSQNYLNLITILIWTIGLGLTQNHLGLQWSCGVCNAVRLCALLEAWGEEATCLANIKIAVVQEEGF